MIYVYFVIMIYVARGYAKYVTPDQCNRKENTEINPCICLFNLQQRNQEYTRI